MKCDLWRATLLRSSYIPQNYKLPLCWLILSFYFCIRNRDIGSLQCPKSSYYSKYLSTLFVSQTLHSFFFIFLHFVFLLQLFSGHKLLLFFFSQIVQGVVETLKTARLFWHLIGSGTWAASSVKPAAKC